MRPVSLEARLTRISDEMRSDPRFQDLRRRYVDDCIRHSGELQTLLGTQGTSAPRGEGAERFRKLAHDMRGTGSAYGFPFVSLHAADLEEAMADGAPAETLRVLVDMLQSDVLQAERVLDQPPLAALPAE